MIELKSLKIELIDYKNIVHLNFLKRLMQSKDINYLWDLTNQYLDNNQNIGKYIIINELDNYIGYLNISNPTEAFYGNTVSLYYAIEESYRGKEYGKRIIQEVSDWLFSENNIECIVAQVDTKNSHSINTLTKAGMTEINNDSEYTTFIQRKNR